MDNLLFDLFSRPGWERPSYSIYTRRQAEETLVMIKGQWATWRETGLASKIMALQVALAGDDIQAIKQAQDDLEEAAGWHGVPGGDDLP